jgi:hypothetical protein
LRVAVLVQQTEVLVAVVLEVIVHLLALRVVVLLRKLH